MLLVGDPEVPVTPSTQIAELLYFRMHVPYVVLHGQASRVEHTGVATKTPENTADLEGQEFGIGAVASQGMSSIGVNETK